VTHSAFGLRQVGVIGVTRGLEREYTVGWFGPASILEVMLVHRRWWREVGLFQVAFSIIKRGTRKGPTRPI
jgi:hypothetical protein